MLPSFAVIGAQKAGTTTLYRHLAAHPDVFMSTKKEPHFFAWEGREFDLAGPRADEGAWQIVTDLDSYERLFDGAREDQARGEASSGYLQAPHAAARMRHHVPALKLVAIFRDPIARARSAFHHARRQGIEPLERFETALAAEPARLADGWTGLVRYVETGRYATALAPYLDVFPASQIRLYLNDDLARSPAEVLSDLYQFLGVDPSFRPEIAARHNVGRAVRSPVLHRVVSRSSTLAQIRRVIPDRLLRPIYAVVNERPPAPLSDTARAWLLDRLTDEVERLSTIMGRDLTPWLSGERVPHRSGEPPGHTPRSAA